MLAVVAVVGAVRLALIQEDWVAVEMVVELVQMEPPILVVVLAVVETLLIMVEQEALELSLFPCQPHHILVQLQEVLP
jgi:hypothetical protein